MSSKKPLSETHPDIAMQWHPDKNGKLTPSSVSYGSNKRVWWVCELGHEWNVQIYNRTSNESGCPYCSGRLACEDNCLQTLNPGIANEWHPTLNGDLTSSDVTTGSRKRVWWICKKGHEWKTSISSRTAGSGCPYCTGKKIGADNNLEVLYPELVKEWHVTKNLPLKPDQISPGSHKKVWWVCTRGHEWKAQIKSRAYNGRDCPKCSNQTSRLEIRLYCELRKLVSNALWRSSVNGVECDVLLPNHGLAIEVDGKHWHDGFEMRDLNKNNVLGEAGINVIRIRDVGLEKIGNLDFVAPSGDDSLSSVKSIFKHLAGVLEQILNGTPQLSGKLRDYQNRDSFLGGMEYRRILSYLPGPVPENSLHAKYPDISLEWHPSKNEPLKPWMFRPMSNKAVWWLCESEHTWKAKISSRTLNETGCPYCSGNYVCKDNCLLSINPELAMEWHPGFNKKLTPSDVTAGSHKRVWWRCSKGHEWEAAIADRNSGSGCPYCSGARTRKDRNLAAMFPELIKEWHPEKNRKLTPDELTPFSGIEIWWLCKNGHTWKAQVRTRTYQGSGCPYCSGNAVCDDNSLASKNPELAKQWHPTKNSSLTPYDVTPGSNRMVWWCCPKGHEWQAIVKSRNRGSGCPYCAGKKACMDNCLATHHPHLVEEWHANKNGNLTPNDVTSFSNRKVWWRCQEGHEWQTRIATRSNGSGCPVCAGRSE